MADLRVPDLNVVYIVGRLTRDPELKYTANNRAYCRFGIANTRYYRTKDGSRGEETTFINCSCWDRQAEWIGERLKKGRPVLIEGSLKSYEAENPNTGQKQTRVEVNARRVNPLDWDDQGPGGGGGFGASASNYGGAAGAGGGGAAGAAGAGGGGAAGAGGGAAPAGGYGAAGGGGGYGQPANPGASPTPGPQGGTNQYQDQGGYDEPIPEDDIPF